MIVSGDFLKDDVFFGSISSQDEVKGRIAGHFNSGEDVANILLDLKDAEVLLYYYGGDSDCGGEALVVYAKNGQLYEVNGSHCSCYGLEGQWGPETTSYEALAMRKYENADKNEAVRRILPLGLAYVN